MFGRSLVCAFAFVLCAGPVAWAADGAAVYKDRCAKCHGAEGKSDTAIAKTMKTPPLAPNADIAAMSESEIVARIKDVKKHPSKTKGMPDDDLNAVAAHVKRLAGAN